MRTASRRQAATPRTLQRIEGLLSVARQVFAARGFESATTQEIAEKAGVSEATVFTYFGSKRELCVEVIRQWYGQITAELEAQLPTSGGLRHQLRFIVRKHLDNLIGEGAGICALVLSEGRTADKAFTDVIAELKRSYTAPLMSMLAAARAAGTARDDIPLRLMRDMVYGSMEHVLWGYVQGSSKPDIALTSEQLSDMLWSAFLPRTASEQALKELHDDMSIVLKRFDDRLR